MKGRIYVERINNLINKLENFIVRSFLAFLVVMVFIAASLRYLGYPIVWSVDMAQLLFVWIVFLGADLALQSHNHIGVDFFVGLLPKKFQRGVYFIHYILMFIFLAAITYYSFLLSLENISRTYRTLGVSYSFATAGVPVGCLLMIRTIIQKLIKGDLTGEDEIKEIV